MSALPMTHTARRRSRGGRSERGDRTIFGVPERFMRPRIILLVTVGIIAGFGLLMVYSASSVTALQSTGDPTYYLKRQLGFMAVGAVAAIVLARSDYRLWARHLLVPIWLVTVGLLLAVILLGTDNDMGATRWINLGFFDLQPSEFAKITIILTAANVAERYFEEGSIDWPTFIKLMIAGVGVPVALILIQPDKGTTMVLALTLIVMGYLAGMPKRLLLGVLVLGFVAFFALSLRDEYSRNRLLAMLDPWSDPFDKGYHLIQGFYAFGSGGLLGVGIGFSRQKYSYLPMAHNDFIFAVIGEECGLVGTLGLLAGFAVFMWAGYQIARFAPDLCGRLVAAGCTSIIMIQLLLNVCGVLGLFPLSGKPIPFVSYGGSSIIASLMLVGLIASVSVHSSLPETSHDSARRSWQVEGEPERASGGRPFTVVEGGAPSRPSSSTRSRERLRSVPGAKRGARGRERVDLGPSASERLRGSRGGNRGTRNGRRGR